MIISLTNLSDLIARVPDFEDEDKSLLVAKLRGKLEGIKSDLELRRHQCIEEHTQVMALIDEKYAEVEDYEESLSSLI